jgi:ElaA protein
VNWHWCRFEDLGVQQLYEALALRSRVFVLEQGPYQDADGLDPDAWHLLGRDSSGALIAYLRVVDPGRKYEEPSIGRVAVAPEARGRAIGRALMQEGIGRCRRAWPGRGIRISAQARLERFYRSLGFELVGAEYLEDGIPHIEMLRSFP